MIEAHVQLQRGSLAIDARCRSTNGILGVCGPSGCGKTTFLHAIAGLIRPAGGRIVLNDRVLFDAGNKGWTPPHRRRIAMVFQDDRLWPHLSVRDNILYGWRRISRDRRRLTLEQVAGWLEIGKLLDRRVTNLSGGERRRVGLARALMCSPDLLLLDEPLTGLDPRLVGQVLDLIGRAIHEAGIPALMVSHHAEHLLQMTDELMIMREGKTIDQCSSMQWVVRSLHEGVLDPEDALTRLPLVVKRHVPEQGVTEFVLDAGEGVAAATVTTAMRPELPMGAKAVGLLRSSQVVLALAPVETVSMQNRLRGRVVEVIEQGEVVFCILDVGVPGVGAPVLAQVTRRACQQFGIAVGKELWCLFKATAIAMHPDASPVKR